MNQVNTRIKYTYRDYRSLPESETRRYELLEGELVVVPSPTEPHQRASWNLAMALGVFVQERALGYMYSAPLDVVLAQDTVLQPDLLFISRRRASIITEENIRGAPDLVVEILSKATAERDRTYKATAYARAGVGEYWLVDPEQRSIEVLVLGEEGFRPQGRFVPGDVLTSPTLPGLALEIATVLQPRRSGRRSSAS